MACARLHTKQGGGGYTKQGSGSGGLLYTKQGDGNGGESGGGGGGFLHKLLEHFCMDYEQHSGSMKALVVRQYFTTCSLMHM